MAPKSMPALALFVMIMTHPSQTTCLGDVVKPSTTNSLFIGSRIIGRCWNPGRLTLSAQRAQGRVTHEAMIGLPAHGKHLLGICSADSLLFC